MGEEDKINMLDYTDDGHIMIKRIKENFMDQYYSKLANKKVEVNKTIKSEFLPKDENIIVLYTELFGSFYSGLFNAALSIGVLLLEYMSKVEYMRITRIEEYPGFNRDKIISYLKQNYENSKRKKDLLDTIDEIRERFRNAQLHGNFDQLAISSGGPFDLGFSNQSKLSKLILTPLNILGKKEKKQREIAEKIIEKPTLKRTKEEKEFIDNLSHIGKLIPQKNITQILAENSALCIAWINVFIVEFYILKE